MVIFLLLYACDAPGDSEVRDSGDGTASGGSDTADVDTAPHLETGDTADTADSGEPAEDRDGDGVPVPEDCDDADAAVYSGAYDWCDGIDQDCDGAPQGEGACGEVGVWSELEVGWWEGTEAGMHFQAMIPVSVDGEPALLGALAGIDNGVVSTDWSAVVAIGGIPGPDPAFTSSVLGVWAAEEYSDHISRGLGADDFDGDGFEDVWIVSEGQSGCCDGSAFLVLGPSTRWPKEGAYIRDVADGWWLQAVENDNFGGDQDAGGDIDGDGLPDAVFLAWGDIWDGTGGGIYIIRGHSGELPNGASIGEEIAIRKSDGRVDDAYYVRIGPDMEGDGTREVLFDAPDHGLGVLSGGDVAVAGGGVLSEWATVVREDDDGSGPEFPQPTTPGDLDGDGLEETILVYQGLPNEEGARGGDESCYLFVSGPDALASGTVAGGTVATACVDNPATGAEYLGADVDFDGVRDLVVTWDTDFTDALGSYSDTDYLTCILPSSRLALGGRIEVRDVSLCYTGAGGTTADLDADGLPELVFAPHDPVTTYEDAGRTDVLPGFLIPWDDPSRW